MFKPFTQEEQTPVFNYLRYEMNPERYLDFWFDINQDRIFGCKEGAD